MKTIILNGSPKASSKTGNTEIFIRHFTSQMKGEYAIRYIAKEKPEVLAEVIKSYDTVLIFMPLYIHAMPSGVMKFIERLEPAQSSKQSIGFIVQAGFPESAQEKYVCDYFEVLAQRLGYKYLGTVVKGGCAFIYQAPDKYKKLYVALSDLGRIFEETQGFDKHIKEQLARPYQFGKFELQLIKVVKKLGLMDGSWNKMMKENGALEHAFDQPFLEK